MTDDSKTCPQLRFSSFTNLWHVCPLGEILSFKRGFDLPSASRTPGQYPIISSAGISGFHSEYKVTGPGLITGRYGSIGDIYLIKDNFWPLNTSLWVEEFYGNNIYFLNYLLQTIDFSRFSDKTGVPGVNRNDLHKIAKAVPELDEQQKIADFLSAVDEKTRLLKEKHTLLQQYKKGVMQKLFSHEIRFEDDNGQAFPDWIEQPFAECFERVTRKNKIDNRNVLTISAQHGLINQEKYFNKSVAAANVTGYYLLNKGEFAYNKSYSKGYPMGAIKRLNNYDLGVVSTLYICFKSKHDQIDEFWEQFFEGGMLNRQISKIAQEGARNHGLLNISVTEFFEDIKVMVPSIEEQRKIANFLQALDKKLDAVQQQIDLTQTFKKGLLQQMFV